MAFLVAGAVLSTLHISIHLILTQLDNLGTITTIIIAIITIIVIILIFQINKLRDRV